ncbi:OmpA family protein [Candidatus Fermentibacterales bacterium]|nr:OmpA family protein [Candidatus Fermentibacterales bacterium]
MRAATALRCLGALLLLACQVSWSLPSVYGLRGLYRVIDARTPPPATYSIALISKYQYAGVSDTVRLRPPGYPDVDTLLTIYDAEHYLDATILVDVGILDYLEIGLTGTYIANVYQYDQESPRGDFVGYLDGSHGFADVMLSGKYSRAIKPWLTVGGALWLAFPPGENYVDCAADYDGYWYSGQPRLQTRRPFLHTDGFSWGLMGLGTAVHEPVEGHMNLGLSGFSQSWEDQVMGSVSESDIAIDFGIGAALPSRSALVYLEYTARFFTGRGDQPGYSPPSRLAGGLRIHQDNGAFLDFAGVVGLCGSFDRREADPWVTGMLPVPGGLDGDWGVICAVGYDTALFGASGTGGSGVVCGTITASETGEPIAARVSFPGHEGTGADSTAANGFFSIPIGSGPLVVRVEADGYVPYTSTVVVPEGGTWAVDFRLERAGPARGMAAGTVTSLSTGDPVRAQVSVSGLADATASSSGSDGSYRLELPEGTWTLQVEAPGFLGATSVVQITAGQTSVVDFAVREGLTQGTVLSFANIYFDSGSATIKTESYPVLDEIADLLRLNANVRVEISGHTDSDGSESYNRTLSENRAASVRDYLAQKGIAATRMTTVGMGESRPVSGNDTAAGKARNRRIEFRVL